MKKDALHVLRRSLQEKDEAILALLNERARLALAVGQAKRTGNREIYDPAQEGRVLTRLTDANEGPLPPEAVRAIFREIISASRALQAPLQVACLGPEASFSHQAALAHFGHASGLTLTGTIGEVFAAVEKKTVSWGVVPSENSLEGSVRQTLDGLITTPAAIRGEIYLRITLCLLSATERRGEISRVYSHGHALAQCRRWLQEHLPGAAVRETESTAAAALQAREDPAGAAVAGRLAAERYGLSILDEGIEDGTGNTTRFLVLGRGKSDPTGSDKTSVLFATPHRPGALVRAIEPFAREGIDMVRIESHPLRDRLWEYLFFVDVAGHKDEGNMARCLRDLAERTTFCKLLGSYPCGDPA